MLTFALYAGSAALIIACLWWAVARYLPKFAEAVSGFLYPDHGARYLCIPPQGYLKFVLPVAGLMAFILAWFIVTDMKLVNPSFLPTPGDTFEAFAHMFDDPPELVPVSSDSKEMRAVEGGWDSFSNTTAMRHGGASVSRITEAVLWACLFGLPLGILMGAFGFFQGLLQALVMPMRNAPIIAFIPLFMIVYGIEEQMKVAFLTFGTLVFIIPTTFDAVRNVPSALIDKPTDHGFRPLGQLWYFVLPAALPRIFDGIRVCTGIAWTYVVAAEIINVTDGLGSVIQQAKRFQDMPKVYASIILILILGVLTDGLFRLIQRMVPMLRQEQA